MRAPFQLIFWGMIIIAVDIKISEFDLFTPDPIGYALILAALFQLSRTGRDFSRAIPYTVISTALSVPITVNFDPDYVLTLASVLFDSIAVWYICTGIMRLAAERGNRDLASVAGTRRTWYGVAALATLTVASLRVVSAELAVMLVIPVAVLILASAILVIHLMRRASLEIA